MQLTVKEIDGHWCFLDKDGVVRKEFNVHGASEFSEGMAAIQVNQCIGYINENFKIVVEPKYGFWCSDFKEGLAVVCTPKLLSANGEKYGYINKKGKEVIPLIFDLANAFYEGVAVVQKSDKWGVIDKEQNQIIDFKYDMISECVNGLFLFAIGHKIGILNKEGKELALSEEVDEDVFYDELYDAFYAFKDYELLKRDETRWVLKSLEGKELLAWGRN